MLPTSLVLPQAQSIQPSSGFVSVGVASSGTSFLSSIRGAGASSKSIMIALGSGLDFGEYYFSSVFSIFFLSA